MIEGKFPQKQSAYVTAWTLYPNNLENRDFDLAKAPGIDDRKSPNINNIGELTIGDPRELSLKSKTDFPSCLSILHQKELLSNWKALTAGKEATKVDPLR
ncbi:MAG: hypothetical protein KBC64_02630 [Simkaniaceae bacterium]|nr:hypothetical protein [Simkaniaceae bacterium]